MRHLGILILAVVAALACAAMDLPAARAEGLIAVAGDQPITASDIDQRIALLRMLGDNRDAGQSRKDILKMLVDEVVKLSEAKRLQTLPTDAEVSKQIGQVAKGMNLTSDQLIAKLTAQGVSTTAFRRYLQAQIGFGRIISGKYQSRMGTVTDADIDRKFTEVQAQINGRVAQLMKDPRMHPINVYSLLQIDLPVENDDVGLIQARAVDAQQLMSRFKGCGSARAAAAGVFNVKIGKIIEADGAKLPPPIRSALDKAGIGHAIGPMRSKQGIQVLALCGTRTVTPPKPKVEMPTRDQVKNMIQNQQYGGFEEDYLKTARKSVYVEYRDPAYAPAP